MSVAGSVAIVTGGASGVGRASALLLSANGAKVVVRVRCEIFPNCPRYVPDLMGASDSVPANPFVPRPGYDPPAPEWKSRDYLKDELSKYDPHRKREQTRVLWACPPSTLP